MSNQRWQSGPLGQLDIATRFLTTLPLPWPAPMQSDGIARSLPFFPLVGAMLGVMLLASGWIAGLFWPPLAQATLIVIAWGIFTGGLHLDGVSDTFDAVMSWRPRERKLEIMKDSRVGVMGVLALIAVLLLKVTLLADAGDMGWFAMLTAPILGRWAMIYAVVSFPAARTYGLGHAAQGQMHPTRLASLSVLVALAAMGIAGTAGACAFVLVATATHALGFWWTRELGGLTGDTYGAICELMEVMALAAITATMSASV